METASLFMSLVTQTVPHPDESLAEFLKFLVQAFQGGNWFVVGAAVVMLTVWVASKYVKDPKWLPFISAGVGMLYSIVAGLAGGKNPWYVELYLGLLTSGSASLFWSTMGKRVLPTWKVPEETAGVLDQKIEPNG